MNLYIARHAAAESGTPDEARMLSNQGIQEANQVRQFLVDNKISFDCALSSPLARAVHTAQILKDDCELIQSGNLIPGATPSMIVSAVPVGKSEILIVGHQPDMGRFISFLISGGTLELEFVLGTCSIAKIEVDRLPLTRPGRLHWIVPPRIL